MSKYIIELKDDIQVVQKVGVTENGNAFVMNFYKDQLEELKLNSDYINEHFGDLQDTAYQRGFEDGKAQSERGCEGCRFEGTEIYLRPCLSPCSACCNAYHNQWTAKQTDDEIKVGDEVADKDGDKTIVTNIHGDLFDGLCSDGSTMTDLFLDDNHKTGRHFDIASILKEMQS